MADGGVVPDGETVVVGGVLVVETVVAAAEVLVASADGSDPFAGVAVPEDPPAQAVATNDDATTTEMTRLKHFIPGW